MRAALLLDVDFTLARPGPELGPIGYQRFGREHGLELDTSLLDASVGRAFAEAERHPELDHDEALWLRVTEAILRGMGGQGAGVAPCAAAITAAWQEAHHFELYDDVLPTLARFRRHDYRIALISNTSRDLDQFVTHHQLDVDAALSSKAHGKMKPHASIFLAALELLGCIPAAAAMVGDSPGDDIAGARALGMRAFLLDRHDRHPAAEGRLRGLDELPAALGLA